MDLLAVLAAFEPMEWLTIGLVVFAGAQLWVQQRSEVLRQKQIEADRAEEIDQAFHFAWAEHFRLEGLADRLERGDLIEMTYLGMIEPADVLPEDHGNLMRALSCMGREAGFLGGVAVSLAYDVRHAMAILIESTKAFARRCPADLSEPEKVKWIRENYGKDLAPWEEAVRELVTELSRLMWDAASHNPRASLVRSLEFHDDLTSDFGKVAVESFVRRAEAGLYPEKPETSKRSRTG